MAFRQSFPRSLWGVLLLFFFVTAWFAVSPDGHFNSPDETTNALFSRRVALGQDLRIGEPLNEEAGARIHPRAMTVVKNDIVPGSFLGLILLYGWTSRIVGAWILPFLTPFFATVALVCFFFLLSFFFNRRGATLATLLLATHPAWLYYTGRAFFPNVPFVSFLLFGGYFLLRLIEQGRPRYAFLAGLCTSIALTIRTVELPWVALVLLAFFFLARKKIPRRSLLLFGAGFVLPFIPILLANADLYGHPFYTGYAQIDSTALPSAFAWSGGVFFLPFGIQPTLLLQHVYAYLIQIFWWFSLPAILGVVLLFKTAKEERARGMRFFLFLCFVGLWLVVYYGSWDIRDSTLTPPTLGTSFTRYWLPIVVLSVPFAAFALLSLIRRASVRWGAIAAISVLGIWTSVFLTGESLAALRTVQQTHADLREDVLHETEEEALILSERLDKVFFPERRVMVDDLNDQENTARVVAELVQSIPVYLVTERSVQDVAFLNETRLSDHGTAWQFRKDVGAFHLYQLEQQ